MSRVVAARGLRGGSSTAGGVYVVPERRYGAGDFRTAEEVVESATLATIARSCGTTEAALRRENPRAAALRRRGGRVDPGDVLWVPETGTGRLAGRPATASAGLLGAVPSTAPTLPLGPAVLLATAAAALRAAPGALSAALAERREAAEAAASVAKAAEARRAARLRARCLGAVGGAAFDAASFDSTSLPEDADGTDRSLAGPDDVGPFDRASNGSSDGFDAAAAGAELAAFERRVRVNPNKLWSVDSLSEGNPYARRTKSGG